MKKLWFSALSLLMLVSFNIQTQACTNYLVTKGASVDGSTMISYAADSHLLYGELYHWPAKKWPAGTMMKIYEWDTGKFLGKIKQAPETYNVVGNMNEHQLAIGETTYGGRKELGSQPGAIMDYGSLIYTTLQRSKNAREAMKTMTDLVAEYGYYSSGESFSIADPNEVWILEMIGKGGEVYLTKNSLKAIKKAGVFAEIVKKLQNILETKYNSTIEFEKAVDAQIGQMNRLHFMDIIMENAVKTEKGAVWVARRIPEGYVSGHANHARIEYFEYQSENKWNDPNATTFNAKDVISFARDKEFFKGDDADFNFSEIYAPVDFGGARYCEMRVWTFFNQVAEGMDQYFEYAKGNIEHAEKLPNGKANVNKYATNRMPLWVKPTNKVSLADVMEGMRDHLEGTELDMSKDLGAGPFGNPYRWRPLTWKHDGITYCNERVTATQQTAFSFVAQCRSWLPNEIGGIIWFGIDDASSSVYFPMYTCATRVPEAFKAGNGSLMNYKKNTAFWAFNEVTNLAYTRYNSIHPEIEKYQSELEGKYQAFTAGIDAAALTLLKTDKALAVEFLTTYSENTGNDLVKKWRDFYEYLIARYIDGNIKTDVPTPKGYKYYAPKLEQPGYSEAWKEAVSRQTGDKLKVIGGGH